MLVWGTNPPNTSPIKASWMMDAKALGARLIVVDPLFSETASKADLWLQLRPGTDAALALGMLNVIINGGLYDKDFVGRWCNGFEELREKVQEYPPEKVAEITWVPAEKIAEAARMYAMTKPACLIECLATEQRSYWCLLSGRAGITAISCCTMKILRRPSDQRSYAASSAV